jgi:hypothetical protein
LQNKTREELKVIVKQKSVERTNIQKEIATLSAKRESYISANRAKGSNQPTLETEVEKIIKTQAKRYNMIIQ